jgi:hypothetical protein
MMRLGAALLALLCLAAGTGAISLAAELCLFPCKQSISTNKPIPVLHYYTFKNTQPAHLNVAHVKQQRT